MLAYVVFLYRRNERISWRESLIVVALLSMGMSTKENAVSMVRVLILTDAFWPPPLSTRPLRNNPPPPPPLPPPPHAPPPTTPQPLRPPSSHPPSPPPPS